MGPNLALDHQILLFKQTKTPFNINFISGTRNAYQKKKKKKKRERQGQVASLKEGLKQEEP